LKLVPDPNLIEIVKVFENMVCPLVLLTTVTDTLPVSVRAVTLSTRLPLISAVT
jgi:hypothetical protein